MEIDEKVSTTLKALENHSFKALYAENRDKARERIIELAEGCKSIGVGGTATVRATGVVDAFREQGLEVFDHWATDKPAESIAARKAQMTADLFITGSNAVTMTGELINREGVGNRTNAMTFGPGKVIVVAGINKIVPDIHAGLERIKKIAAPGRAKQLGLKTPCVEEGECADCNTPQRICRVTVIHERRPVLTDVTVIIIGEELGL